MPTYAYFCHKCESEFDVIKPSRDIDFIEICEDCGYPSERVIRFKGHVSADNGAAYYNYGLGKVVRSKNDIRQEISRVKGETGQEIVEIGNETIKKAKPRKTEWFGEKEVQEFKKVKSGHTKH